MEWVRSGGSNAKGPTPKEAYGVQNNSQPSSCKAEASSTSGESLLSSLETPSRTVFLGSLNKTTVKLQNRFDALRKDDDTRSQFGSIRSQFCLKPAATLKPSISKNV